MSSKGVNIVKQSHKGVQMASTLDKRINTTFQRIQQGSATNRDMAQLLTDHFVQDSRSATTAGERRICIAGVEEFLVALADPKTITRVPKHVRTEARKLLKHLPTQQHMTECENLTEPYSTA